eukprot:TRINITY_DN4590_c0_g1_i5.p2 TRINITY_DN4590_c0_g1~~TRINITY_DN4590_c0_g1_i5.p2  ORF type:complete len:353 (+),score=55.66 TRINITY_DN4590_c0_g1_i5:623-1681(+)
MEALSEEEQANAINAEKTCYACDSSCLNCNITGKNCTSCWDYVTVEMLEDDTNHAEGTNLTEIAQEINNNIVPFYYESQCLAECPYNYSADYLDNKTCKNFICADPCFHCGWNETICVHCNTSSEYKYWNSNYTCLKKCPINTYVDLETLFCEPCDFYHRKVCIYEEIIYSFTALPYLLVLGGMGLIAFLIIIISGMNNWKYLEIIPAIMALYCPIEMISRVFMLVNAYDIELKEAVSIIIGSCACSFILSIIFIVKYFEKITYCEQVKEFANLASFYEERKQLILLKNCIVWVFVFQFIFCVTILIWMPINQKAYIYQIFQLSENIKEIVQTSNNDQFCFDLSGFILLIVQ